MATASGEDNITGFFKKNIASPVGSILGLVQMTKVSQLTQLKLCAASTSRKLWLKGVICQSSTLGTSVIVLSNKNYRRWVLTL